jgi:hypothetical protein
MFQGIKDKIKACVSAITKWVIAESRDRAVRRAILLALAAYLIRKAPFLDEQTAEGLATQVLLVGTYVVSKLPGSAELRRLAGDGSLS